MTLRVLLLLFVWCGSAAAQTVAIRAGQIDPATGHVTDSQVILVREGKIAAVGSGLAIPAGLRSWTCRSPR